jgi:hypothetical protein
MRGDNSFISVTCVYRHNMKTKLGDSTRNSYFPCLPNPVHQHSGPVSHLVPDTQGENTIVVHRSRSKNSTWRFVIMRTLSSLHRLLEPTRELVVCLFPKAQAPSAKSSCGRADVRCSSRARRHRRIRISALPSHKLVYHKTQGSKKQNQTPKGDLFFNPRAP